MSVGHQPPGPKGHWLKGNLPEFRRDTLGFFSRCAREYGDIVSLKLGPKRVFLINHPDLIEEVLVRQNRNFIKHFITRMLASILGEALRPLSTCTSSKPATAVWIMAISCRCCCRRATRTAAACPTSNCVTR